MAVRPPDPTRSALAAALALSCAAALALAAPGRASVGSTAALSPTPPMGWSSWYRFGCGITQALFERTAAAIASNGMKAAGYRYVDVDDCWLAHRRDRRGRLAADSRRFPDGIAGLARGVHALGLKLGIYLDVGTATCAGFPGSRAHEGPDSQTIAGWGVDALKLDFCRARPAAAEPIYRGWQRALARTGRAILLSICEWGYESPWTWAPGVGSTWRTTGDYATYGALHDPWGAVLRVLDLNAPLAAFARPGAYNDPNALLVGTGMLTLSEERAQISLWSMLAAPLIAGGDLDWISKGTLGVLTNRAVIAVDQDREAVQGVRLAGDAAHQLWLRRLGDGSRVLLFLNPRGSGSVQRFDLASIGLPAGHRYTMRDLWSGATLSLPSRFAVWVGGHDVRMLELGPQRTIPYAPAGAQR